MSIATIRVIIYCLIGLSAYFAVRLVYLVLNKSDAISEYAANRLKAWKVRLHSISIQKD